MAASSETSLDHLTAGCNCHGCEAVIPRLVAEKADLLRELCLQGARLKLAQGRLALREYELGLAKALLEVLGEPVEKDPATSALFDAGARELRVLVEDPHRGYSRVHAGGMLDVLVNRDPGDETSAA